MSDDGHNYFFGQHPEMPWKKDKSILDTIICANFQGANLAIPDEYIDLVITDPPYPKEYFRCFELLAIFSPRLMKHGASLLTVVGHYQIDKVIMTFQDHLKFRWVINLDQQTGKHARMAMGIEVMWKPMLWYVKGSYPSGRGFLRDAVNITGKDGQEKKLHKWQQDEQWCEYYIQRLTKPGDVVLDPFCGSGTALVVAKKLGRHYIGIDIDPEACETAKKRLDEI